MLREVKVPYDSQEGFFDQGYRHLAQSHRQKPKAEGYQKSGASFASRFEQCILLTMGAICVIVRKSTHYDLLSACRGVKDRNKGTIRRVQLSQGCVVTLKVTLHIDIFDGCAVVDKILNRCARLDKTLNRCARLDKTLNRCGRLHETLDAP